MEVLRNQELTALALDHPDEEPSPSQIQDPDETSGSFFVEQPPETLRTARHMGRNTLRLADRLHHTESASDNEPQKLDEISDGRSFIGEATGFPRKVWLLGREFADHSPPVVVTKPLGVKFTGYVQEHVATICPAIKRPVLVLGSVGFDHKRKYSRTDRSKFHMSWMATDIHSILNRIENGQPDQDSGTDWPQLSFRNFDYFGASQGAMVGLELAGQAKHFDRQIGKAVLIAPAGLAQAGDFTKPQELVRALGFAKQFGWDEFWGVCKYLVTLDTEDRKRAIQRYLPTIPVPRSAIIPLLSTGMEILKSPMRGIGNTISSAQCQTELELLLFDQDAVSTPTEWQQELNMASSLNITYRKGHHITSIISPETDDFIIGHLKQQP